MPAKDCPLCGEAMQLQEHETVVEIPGDPKPMTKRTQEWVCPECDYFEDEEEGL